MTQPIALRAPRRGGSAGAMAMNVLAISIVGDGVVAMIWPRRQLALWLRGPEPYRRLTYAVGRRPWLVRSIALTEIVLGLWWNRRIYEESGV